MSTVIILDVLLLVTLMIMGVPVALTFVAAALFLVIVGDYGSTTFLITSGFSKVASVVLLAIPLYILAGAVMTQGGIANRLLEFADSFFGRFRSGLGFVVVVTTAVFGAISGMASSAVAAIGSITIPRMVEQGYDRGYATSLVSCSAVLALLIPPSATMILFGWVTGTSIARTVADRMRAAPARSRMRAAPAALLTTFLTGQPKLMSMTAAPRSTQRRAASAMTSGSQPASCTQSG